MSINTDTSLFDAILSAGIAVQFLLLVLIVMSIVSWAIIIMKMKQFKAIESSDLKFLDLFWSTGSLQQVDAKADHHADSSMSRIFKTGFSELTKIEKQAKKDTQLITFGLEHLENTLHKSQDKEISALEQRLSFLATTGSTAPFIGLLGTVIGIMNSFQDISRAGSASLATVAPGISEALFATAIGLFAAIPAVIAYNYMLSRLKQQENSMNNFISEFLNVARLQLFRQS